ncbi:MAG: SWIM zinc finger family protein [Anaerolineae bacterium]
MTELPKITQTMIQQATTAQSFARGEDYYATGAVLELVRRGDTLYAEVAGSAYEPYRIEITFTETGVNSAFCTCPYDWGGWCKHIVAVLLAAADAPDTVEARPTVDVLIEALDAAQLRAVVQALVARHPELIHEVESCVAVQASESAPSGAPPSSPAALPPRPAVIDPAPFRRQVHTILHSLDRMRRSEAYWHVGSVVDEVRGLLDQAWQLIEAGDGNNALRVLEGITDAYVNEWYNLDDSDGEASGFFADLAPVWIEAALTADLTPEEREQWIEMLEDWQDEIDRYGIDEGFDAAMDALRQGWDYPPLLRVIRDGEITEDGAWEDGKDVPYYADELAVARLNVLERQGRYQEYLNLAQAESQLPRYVTMLVRLDRIDEAVADGLRYLTLPQGILTLAQALHERGHTQEALRVAEHGLELEGHNKAPLATWLRDVALDAGETDLALRAAVTGFKASVDLDAYRKIQDLAGDRWEALRQELLEMLRQRTGYTNQAVIEIFLHEGLIDDAIRALGDYPHYSTVELIVNAAIESRPDWCIQACRRQAEPIMDQGQSKYYSRAAYWLGRAKAAYLSAGRSDEWRAYLESLLQKHARKYSLVPLLRELK